MRPLTNLNQVGYDERMSISVRANGIGNRGMLGIGFGGHTMTDAQVCKEWAGQRRPVDHESLAAHLDNAWFSPSEDWSPHRRGAHTQELLFGVASGRPMMDLNVFLRPLCCSPNSKNGSSLGCSVANR